MNHHKKIHLLYYTIQNNTHKLKKKSGKYLRPKFFLFVLFIRKRIRVHICFRNCLMLHYCSTIRDLIGR